MTNKLYSVLVLGGAALSAACGSDDSKQSQNPLDSAGGQNDGTGGATAGQPGGGNTSASGGGAAGGVRAVRAVRCRAAPAATHRAACPAPVVLTRRVAVR